MNKVIEIPKELSKNQDLIIIPRSDYEELLTLKKIFKTYKLTSSEKRDIKKAREDFAKGNYITLEELNK